MTPRRRAFFQFATLLMVAVLLIVLFKPVAAFAEMAARELRYFWWLILLVGLAGWLIWGINRRPKP
jgi:hypothetical protein